MRGGYFPSELGAGFASVIRAAIGPEERLRIAKDRYVRGEIELEEYERLVSEILQ